MISNVLNLCMFQHRCNKNTFWLLKKKKKKERKACLHPRRAYTSPTCTYITEQDAWMWQRPANMGDECLSSRSSALNWIAFYIFMCLFLSWCTEQCGVGGDISFRMAAVGERIGDGNILLSTKYAHLVFYLMLYFQTAYRALEIKWLLVNSWLHGVWNSAQVQWKVTDEQAETNLLLNDEIYQWKSNL